MRKESAGLLMFRPRNRRPQMLLVHLGGPFWARKNAGAWFIPKGEVNPEEDLLTAARREFQEETGLQPRGDLFPLGAVRQKSGKVVHAWAFEGDCDPQTIRSNFFTIEWPPRSGQLQEFPEVDRAAFFTVEQAKKKMHPAEFELVLRLIKRLQGEEPSSA